jgi:hypothetical protein
VTTLAAVAALRCLLLEPAAAAEHAAVSDVGFRGMQAVQFSVGGNFSISEFQGALVSYQRFVRDRRAVRIACGLRLDLDDSEMDVEFEGIDASDSVELSRWSHEGTVRIQMLFYRGSGPVYLYYGGGPVVSYLDYLTEDMVFSADGSDLEYRYFGYEGSEWGLGLDGVLGIHWPINETFALHAEYGATAEYKLRESSETYFRSDAQNAAERIERRTKSPEFSSNGVLVGLSVFF